VKIEFYIGIGVRFDERTLFQKQCFGALRVGVGVMCQKPIQQNQTLVGRLLLLQLVFQAADVINLREKIGHYKFGFCVLIIG